MNVAVRPDSLNIISLCTGGGGLDLGVELAIPSARSVVLVEREAFACSHLVSAMQQGLMAQAALWSDVTTFNGRPWRGIVDGLIGGIPCQPHSLAGRRQGSEDERDLWSDARRIIVQSGAWFVLIENVRGMLSAGADEIAGAERVWRDLRRLGFAVEGGLFTAAEVGASHERERIFILAVADAYRRHPPWRPSERPETGGGRPYDQPARSGAGLREVADAGRQRSAPRISGSIGPGEEGLAGEPFDGCDALAYASIARSGGISIQPGRQDEAGSDFDRRGLFPPGPSDLSSWRHILERAPELEPAFRRVADGLASRLDIARVDRLRMLGNGVVSLQAAYALRTLATRLAASGSAAAAKLVGMMEAA